MSSEMIRTSASGKTTNSQPTEPGSNPMKRKRADCYHQEEYQELLDRRNKLIWLIMHKEGRDLLSRRMQRLMKSVAEVREEFRTRYPDPCQPVPYTDGLIPEIRMYSNQIAKLQRFIRSMFPHYDTTTLEEDQACLQRVEEKILTYQ